MGSATDVSNPDKAAADLQALDGKQEAEREEHSKLQETRQRIERAQSRGLGRMTLTVNYPREGKEKENVTFTRLPIKEANKILDRVEELDREGKIGSLGDLITEALAEWCLDPDKDRDHWESELTVADGVGLLQKVALGGNRDTT